MTDLTIPAEAVEAALWAWIESATEGVTRENVAPRVLDLNRPRAAAALTATLPILHPTIPNTVEALGALPVGSVIRGNDADGPVAERETSDEWAIWDGSYTTPQVVGLGQRYDIAEWTLLWPLGGAA